LKILATQVEVEKSQLANLTISPYSERS